MRRIATFPALLLAVALSLLTGCHSTGVRFLSLIGLEKQPLSVALVAGQPTEAVAEALNPFPAYAALQKALSEQLGRPVAVDVCFPFQVDSSLVSGWYDLAVVTPSQYAGLTEPQSLRVLAIPLDQQHRPARSAVLVVSAGSPVQTMPELRGRAVAFGPPGDSRTHYAALLLLQEAGLKKTDLALDLLPVPGSLKHLPDMRSVAQTVIAGSAAAGFIDEAAWAAFPTHSAQAGEPAQDKLRALARTRALPDSLVVASPKLDAATADRVQAFLLAAGTEHPDALEPLALSGYQTPTADLLSACRSLSSAERAPAPQAPPAGGSAAREP